MSSLYEGKTSQWIKSTLQQLKDKKVNLDSSLQTQIQSHHNEVVQFVSAVNQCVDDMTLLRQSLNLDFTAFRNSISQDQQQNQTSLKSPEEGPQRKECNNPDIEWLMHDFIDEVDVTIAHREFSSAVQLINKGCKVQQSVGDEVIEEFYGQQSSDQIKSFINERREKLSQLLLKIDNFEQLVLLGPSYAQLAQQKFFQMKQHLIDSKIKEVSDELDLESFIHDFCSVYFTLVSRIINESKRKFQSPNCLVSLINWLKLQIHWLIQKFLSFVLTPNQKFSTIVNCIQYLEANFQVIAKSGIDITPFFLNESGENTIKIKVQQGIEFYVGNLISKLAVALADDEFLKLSKIQEFECTISESKHLIVGSAVSSCCVVFCQLLFETIFIDFRSFIQGNKEKLLFFGNFQNTIVASIVQIFEYFTRRLIDILKDGNNQFSQKLLIIQNLDYLSNHVLPILVSALQTGCTYKLTNIYRYLGKKCPQEKVYHIEFGRKYTDLDKLHEKVLVTKDVAVNMTCYQELRQIVKDTWCFGPSCVGHSSFEKSQLYMSFSGDAYPVVEQLIPTDQMIRLVSALKHLEADLDQFVKQFDVQKASFETKCPIDKKFYMCSIMQILVNDLQSDSNWMDEKGNDRIIGYTGLHQFLLDVHFFTKLCDSYLNNDLLKICTDLCSKGVKFYFKQCNEVDKKRVLKSGDWYEKRFQDFIKKEKITRLGLNK